MPRIKAGPTRVGCAAYWLRARRFRGWPFCLTANRGRANASIDANKKGGPSGPPFFLDSRYLRQVVTERGPDHVVRSLGTVAGVGCATRAGPEVLTEVAVFDALAQTALGPTVDVVPVAGCAFL